MMFPVCILPSRQQKRPSASSTLPLLVCLVFVFLPLPIFASSAPLATPIREWDGSWAASSAHGAAMAVKCRDGCVVVMTVSPRSNVARQSSRRESDEAVLVQDVSVRLVRDASRAAFAPAWTRYGGHSLLCMTGLATDVEHITRVLQKRASDHAFVYDDDDDGGGGVLPHAARYLHRATRTGARPYAIQGLLLDQKNSIITLEPSGSWQSWGLGAAVGRHAGLVRKRLGELLSTLDGPPSAKAGAEALLKCWYQACQDSGRKVDLDALENSEKQDDEFEIIVAWKCPDTPTEHRLGKVDKKSDQMIDIRKAVKESLQEERKGKVS